MAVVRSKRLYLSVDYIHTLHLRRLGNHTAYSGYTYADLYDESAVSQ